jgi:hypothetical protein
MSTGSPHLRQFDGATEAYQSDGNSSKPITVASSKCYAEKQKGREML